MLVAHRHRTLNASHFPSCSMTVFFFFQAEDGIRAADVTGVQTCALPILALRGGPPDGAEDEDDSGEAGRPRKAGGRDAGTRRGRARPLERPPTASGPRVEPL